MTREEAIKEFESELEWAELNMYPYISKQKVEADKMAIKALEQEPTWIPVSERLPEDSEEYFVTVDAETYKHTGIAWYAHPKDYDIEEGEWRELMTDEKVIAWMPLPKPYEAKSEE